MKIIVDHDGINEVSSELKSEAKELDTYINDLLGYIRDIPSAWEGGDSALFCKKASNYVENIKQIPSSLREFSSFMEKADFVYADRDETWTNEFKKEDENFE